MLNRGSIFAAAVVIAALAPTGASAYLFRVGPHPYPLQRNPELLPARAHGCPGGMKREHVCVRWYTPHPPVPNPTPVCIRYEWVNRCTT